MRGPRRRRTASRPAATACPRSSCSTSPTATWVRLPHLAGGARYAVAEPARYVDPTTGTVLVRFVNDRSDGVGFSFDLSIDGDDPMTAIVRTDGLVKRYDGTLAVAGVDLAVEPGEIFGLVGPNGAGKTTTLRILATLLGRPRGDAEIAGWSVTRNPDAGPARPRVHAGRLRGLRRHEGLGVPRLLRPLLRHRRRPAGGG